MMNAQQVLEAPVTAGSEPTSDPAPRNGFIIGSCNDCGREWSGHTEAHCSVCCRHFTSDSAFDLHLAGPQSDDACYPPDSIEDRKGRPVLTLADRRGGETWKCHSDRPHPFASKQAVDVDNGANGNQAVHNHGTAFDPLEGQRAGAQANQAGRP